MCRSVPGSGVREGGAQVQHAGGSHAMAQGASSRRDAAPGVGAGQAGAARPAPGVRWMRQAQRHVSDEYSCRGPRLQLPCCAVPRMDVPASPRSQPSEDAHWGFIATSPQLSVGPHAPAVCRWL
ncbi:unnamed protein product [Urochloa humidicola]